jgi:DNA-directed RNA polymerase specialized sigma24 family protein
LSDEKIDKKLKENGRKLYSMIEQLSNNNYTDFDKPNFINYSYREEMISDGIENCLQYIDNFDPTKSNNPFAYFTQIIYYAFLRRIAKEKKQSYIKGKLIQDMPFEMFEVQEGDDKDYHNAYMDFVQNNSTFDDSWMDRKKEKAAKRKVDNTLNSFLDDENDTGLTKVDS